MKTWFLLGNTTSLEVFPSGDYRYWHNYLPLAHPDPSSWKHLLTLPFFFFFWNVSPSFSSLFYPWGYKLQNFKVWSIFSLTSASNKHSFLLILHLQMPLFSCSTATDAFQHLFIFLLLDLKPCNWDSSTRRFLKLRVSPCLFFLSDAGWWGMAEKNRNSSTLFSYKLIFLKSPRDLTVFSTSLVYTPSIFHRKFLLPFWLYSTHTIIHIWY